jgi:hypothetical protein
MKVLRGEAVYLLLGATMDQVLRLKPQKRVAGSPIRQVEVVD